MSYTQINANSLPRVRRIRSGWRIQNSDYATDWMDQAGQEDLSFQKVHTNSGAHPASYSVGTGGSFTALVKRQSRENDHLSPSIVEVKNEWSYTDTNPVRTGICLPFTEQRLFTLLDRYEWSVARLVTFLTGWIGHGRTIMTDKQETTCNQVATIPVSADGLYKSMQNFSFENHSPWTEQDLLLVITRVRTHLFPFLCITPWYRTSNHRRYISGVTCHNRRRYAVTWRRGMASYQNK